MYRVLIAAAAVLTLSACQAPTAPAPTSRALTPTSAAHDDEPIADPTCRSGWSVANGRCL